MPRRQPDPRPLNDPARGERLQRVLAEAGVAARRTCEAMIEQGRVKVNGRKADRLPIFVDREQDSIEVDGRPLLRAERHIYVMMNKPTRMLTLPAGPGDDRPSVAQAVRHPSKARLLPAGGLDFDTTGLVLLTNDGEVINAVTHPRYGVERIYEVSVRGRPDAAALDKLRKGVYVFPGQKEEGEDGSVRMAKGRPEGARKVKLEVEQGGSGPDGAVLHVRVTMARDDEIRTALHLCGVVVKRLTCVGIGGLRLRGLALGQWRELDRDEQRTIKAAGRSKGRRTSGGGRSGSRAQGAVRGPASVASRTRHPADGRPALEREGARKPEKPLTDRPARRPRVIGGDDQ